MKALLRVRGPKRLRQLGRAMLDSIRTRLTLWYTGVLALVIVVLCGVAYFIFWRSAVRRTDVNLVELSNSFLVTLRAELEDQIGPDVFQTAAREAVEEHHFRDTVYVIADDAGRVILNSQETLPANAPAKAARRQILSSDSFSVSWLSLHSRSAFSVTLMLPRQAIGRSRNGSPPRGELTR